MIKPGKAKHENNKLGGSKVKFQFKVMNDIHQIARLDSSEIIEEWNEEEKVVIKKPVPAPVPAPKKEEAKEGEEKKEEVPVAAPVVTEQDFELKQRKKTASYPLAFDTQAHALPPSVRQNYRKLEIELMSDDRKFLDLKEAKNDLETYCYEFRNNLAEGAIYDQHIDPAVRSKFLAEINVAVDWLYGAGETAPLDEFLNTFNGFKAIGDPIKKRFVYYSTISESFKVFENLCVRIQNQLANNVDMADHNRKAVIDKVAVVQEYMSRVREEFDTKPKFIDSVFSLDGVQSKIELLDSETKAIFAIPPPKKEAAKPEEEKPEEPMPQMEENVDVEMKDETGTENKAN
jgi:heat shock protein 4